MELVKIWTENMAPTDEAVLVAAGSMSEAIDRFEAEHMVGVRHAEIIDVELHVYVPADEGVA